MPETATNGVGVITRRRAIAGAILGATSLAGCTSSSGGAGPKHQLLSGTFAVDEDGYHAWSFSFDQHRKVSYNFTVDNGPAIDVFVMDSRGFDHYKNKENFQFVGPLSFTGTRGGSRGAVLKSGSYYFVLDNTDMGGARPPANFKNDVATVQVSVYEGDGNA